MSSTTRRRGEYARTSRPFNLVCGRSVFSSCSKFPGECRARPIASSLEPIFGLSRDLGLSSALENFIKSHSHKRANSRLIGPETDITVSRSQTRRCISISPVTCRILICADCAQRERELRRASGTSSWRPGTRAYFRYYALRFCIYERRKKNLRDRKRTCFPSFLLLYII